MTLSGCAAALRQAFATGEGCDAPTGRARGRRLDRVSLGGRRDVHLSGYKIGRKQTRKGIDRFCLSDARGVRVGYSTKRFRTKLGRQARRYASEQGAARTHHQPALPAARRCAWGPSERVVRRRTSGGIPIRIGSNRWYVRRAKSARLVIKVRGGKVREIGIVNKKFTPSQEEDTQGAGRLAPRLNLAWGYV